MGHTTATAVFALVLCAYASALIIDNKFSPWDFLVTPGNDHPSPREGHSATIVGQNVYVFGGYYPARPLWGNKRVPTAMYDQLFAFNLNSLEWSHVSGTFSSKRHVELENAMGIEVAAPAPITEDDLERHRPHNLPTLPQKTKTTRQSGDGPGATADHAAAGVNGILYVFGGLKTPGNVASNELWAYVPAQNAWTLISTGIGPSPRAGAVAWSAKSKFYVFGGYDPATNELKTDTWSWDPSQKKWTVIQTATSSGVVPGPRVYNSMAQTPAGPLLYSGRQSTPYSSLALASDALVYNNEWVSYTIQKTDNYPNPAADAAVAYYDEGYVVVVGGYAGPYSNIINRCGWYSPDNSNYEGFDPVGEVRIYNIAQDSWIRGTDAPFYVTRNITARIGRAPAIQYGNSLVLFGGVGCEDKGTGKPFPAIYGQFNQIPIYNLLSDPRFSSAPRVGAGLGVVFCVLVWVFFGM